MVTTWWLLLGGYYLVVTTWWLLLGGYYLVVTTWWLLLGGYYLPITVVFPHKDFLKFTCLTGVGHTFFVFYAF